LFYAESNPRGDATNFAEQDTLLIVENDSYSSNIVQEAAQEKR
jgi:hypothetical protein